MFWESNPTHTVSGSGGCFVVDGEEVAEVGEGISKAGEGFAEGGEGVSVNGEGVTTVGNYHAGRCANFAKLGEAVSEVGGGFSLTRSGGAAHSSDAPIDCCLLSHDFNLFGWGG